MKSAAVVVSRCNKLAIFKNMQKEKVGSACAARHSALSVGEEGGKGKKRREKENKEKNMDDKRQVRERLNRTKHPAFMGSEPLSGICLVFVDGSEESSRNGFFKSTTSGVFSLSLPYL